MDPYSTVPTASVGVSMRATIWVALAMSMPRPASMPEGESTVPPTITPEGCGNRHATAELPGTSPFSTDPATSVPGPATGVNTSAGRPSGAWKAGGAARWQWQPRGQQATRTSA